MDNAPTSFEVYVDGELTYFTFYSCKVTGNTAVVKLRLEWPIAMNTPVSVVLRGGAPQPVPELVEEIVELEEIIEIDLDYVVEVDNTDDLEIEPLIIE
jgi:hypothetical protein